MLEVVMSSVMREYWGYDPLVRSGLKLLKSNGNCGFRSVRVIACNSNECIIFGDCRRKGWDFVKVIKKRMMKRMNITAEQLEEFIFDNLL